MARLTIAVLPNEILDNVAGHLPRLDGKYPRPEGLEHGHGSAEA